MAVVLATVQQLGLQYSRTQYRMRTPVNVMMTSIAAASSMGENGQGDGEQDDSGVAKLAVM